MKMCLSNEKEKQRAAEHHAGYQAFNEGKECDENKSHSWIIGWLDAQIDMLTWGQTKNVLYNMQED